MKKKLSLCGMMMVALCALSCTSTKKISVADLNGKWNIVSINDETLQTEKMENTPFIEIDVAGKRMTGNAGCNIMNSPVEFDDSDKTKIKFTRASTTMMMCPDMETEGKILNVINNVSNVSAGSDDAHLKLTNGDGKLYITLEKSK